MTPNDLKALIVGTALISVGILLLATIFGFNK